MNKKSFKLIGLVALVASTVLLVACQSETKTKNSKSKDVQWGYTGSTGPDHWGDLSKDYELSKNGKEQSPINITSVLYNYGDENQALKQIWDKMPQAANTETELSQAISLDDFYPEDKDYYNFEGSLTTPPCTEGVNWIVFKNQETVSKEQVEKFTQTLGFENNRPIQDTNGRKIKE